MAVTFRDGTLWIYDAEQQKEYDGASFSGTDFMACGFDETNRLWVVGSNEITAPIIEASYKRFIEQLE